MRVSGLRFGVILLVAVMAARGAVCVAQEMQLRDAGTAYRIAGRVVSAMDGRAVQRAEVQITDTKSRKVMAMAFADELGGFAFTGLKAGGYELQGKARGYITSAYEHHGVYSTAIVTGAGVDTESLVLRLTPEATIGGRITDEASEAVRHAQVSLYFENRALGKVRIQRMRTAQTDDLGDYEMAHLQPGRYFVEATGKPWYAMHLQAARQVSETGNSGVGTAGIMAGIVDSVDPSLDVVYGTTFYPGVTDPEAASVIVVKGGDAAQADLRMVPEAAVTITIPRAPGEKNASSEQLQKVVFGGLEPVMSETRVMPTETVIVGVPAGKYVLKETNQQDKVSRTIAVEASGRSVEVDASQSLVLGTVKVLAKTADGAKLPAQLQVTLTPKDGGQGTVLRLNGKGEAQADGVSPGEYRIVPAGRYYLASAALGGRALLGGHIVVAAGTTVTVELVVGAGRATLQGMAKRDGRPGAGAMILMVPVYESGADWSGADAFWRDQTDLDGSFRLANVLPGRYLLVAIDDGWELEWQRPEVLGRYLPQGVAVEVPEGGGGVIQLPVPVTVQSR